MAQSIDVDTGVGVIVALALAGILAAFLLAPALTDLTEAQNSTFVQNESETVTPVAGKYTGNLTDVSDTTTDITVLITDIDSGDTESNTIAENSSADYTVNGNSVTVFNNNKIDNTTANVTYQNSREYGWSSGAKSIYGILDLVLILTLLILVFGWLFVVRP